MKVTSLHKLAKRDVRALYNISHTTFIRWLRRAGLGDFVGRKKFLSHEVVFIFKALGRPVLARTAAQRLIDIYHQIRGWEEDAVGFRKKYQRARPQVKQEVEEPREEEMDHPPIFTLPVHQTPQWSLLDALRRLGIVALNLEGIRALEREQKLEKPAVAGPATTGLEVGSPSGERIWQNPLSPMATLYQAQRLPLFYFAHRLRRGKGVGASL